MLEMSVKTKGDIYKETPRECTELRTLGSISEPTAECERERVKKHLGNYGECRENLPITRRDGAGFNKA